MQSDKMNIEKNDVQTMAWCALGGFLLVAFAVREGGLMTSPFTGFVAGVPCGIGGGALVCIFRRLIGAA